jgi:hypothetical protein
MEVDPIVYGDGTNYYQAYGGGPATRVDPGGQAATTQPATMTNTICARPAEWGPPPAPQKPGFWASWWEDASIKTAIRFQGLKEALAGMVGFIVVQKVPLTSRVTPDGRVIISGGVYEPLLKPSDSFKVERGISRQAWREAVTQSSGEFTGIISLATPACSSVRPLWLARAAGQRQSLLALADEVSTIPRTSFASGEAQVGRTVANSTGVGLRRVTQYYEPAKGAFPVEGRFALSSEATLLNRLGDGITGPTTWVAPRAASEMNWWRRFWTGVGNRQAYVEFDVLPWELQAPGGLKSLFSSYQQVIPGRVDLLARNPVYGFASYNYLHPVLKYGVPTAGGTALGYSIYSLVKDESR